MSIRRLPLLTLAACLLGASPAAAQPNGGTESNLALGVGSRSIALGGAALARLDDASALYWNPAGLAALERGNLVVMHAPIGYGDASQSYFGVAYPTFGAGSLGLGWVRLATGGIAAYDAASTPLGEIEFTESAFLFGYAARPRLGTLGRAIAIGVTAKVLTQSLGDYSSTSAGLDAGLTVNPEQLPNLGLAVVMQDALAPQPRLDRDADRIPSTLRLAGSYRLVAGTNLALDVHGGADHLSTVGWSPRYGIECTYRGALRLRLGGSRHGMAFGVGLGWSGYALDYAYVSQAGSGTHPVSLEAGWGRSEPERLAARAAAQEQELRAHMQERLEERLANAQAAYDRGDYAAALDEWKVVAGLDPSEERAQRGMQAASAKLTAQQARSLADQNEAAERAAQFALALKYYTANDYALASNVWRDVLARDPDNAEAARYLGKSEEELREQVRQRAAQAHRYESSGDWVSALATWTQVRIADPEHPEAEPGLERCRTALVRPTTPSKPARAVKQPAPSSPRAGSAGSSGSGSGSEALYREALSLYSAGKLDRALPLLREVRKLDPGNEAAAQLLAKTERQLRPLGPEDRARVRELYLRGMSHFTANQFEQAIAEWTKILALDPTNTSIYQNIEDARARLRALQQ